jgi:tetratricopeptide (TPR) repeat protein
VLLVLMISVAAPVILGGFWLLGLAISDADAGRYAGAARAYELAAQRLVWRSDLWERAGLLAYRSGDYDGALRLLTRAKSAQSISARGWDAWGSAYWTMGDLSSATSTWKAGVEAFPRDTLLLDRLAGAYHQLLDYADERDTLARRLRLGDDAAAHYRLGLILMAEGAAGAKAELEAAGANSDYAPAVGTLLAALKVSATEPESADRSVLIGRGLGLVDEWGLASLALENAIGKDATNAEAWAWLGEARQHTGQDGGVELDRALSLDAGDGLIHVLRGLRWRRQANQAAALAEYLQGVQLEPDNAALRSALGDAYAAAGDLVAALGAYQAATSIAPNDPTYWRLLAAFCADNGVQVTEIGLPAAEQADKLRPHDPEVLDTLAWSYAQAGFPAKAEQAALNAIRGAPGLALAHLHLAEIYLMSGRNALAFEQLTAAQDLDPDGSSGQTAAALLSRYFP